MSQGKIHLGMAIVGHVDSGKSTITGRLTFELGGLSDRDLKKLRKQAQELGMESFLFAFCMNKSIDERSRGYHQFISYSAECFTNSFHYTIINISRSVLINA